MYWNESMDGADWLWMTVSMSVMIVLLGAVIYLVTRLALRDREREHRS